MTKYVVPVPDPAPGADWQTVVPGIYTWDVVGITATLDTVVPAPAPQQLFYGSNDFPGTSILNVGVQPFSLTENQLQIESEQFPSGLSNPFPSIADDVRHMFAWVWDGAAAHYYVDGVDIGAAQAVAPSTSPAPMTAFELGRFAPASTIVDELASFRTALSGADVAALHAAGLTGFAAYNAAVLALTPATYYHFDGPSPTTTCVDASGNGNDGSYTSVSGSPDFVPGLVAGNDALEWGTHVGVNETRVVPAPLDIDWTTRFTLVLWSLQESGATSTGRTPSLVVSNGTDDVLVIPAGFQAVTTPGPYSYAWQPGLNADTQSTDGTLTTVAIPTLVIPAGYTVGTQTFDLAPTDQWSNIALWWDDVYQTVTSAAYDYGFPPGRFYTYKQSGTAP